MMGLNKSRGNMYEFVTHTWNAIKGACPHDCSYCYMKRWGKLNPIRLDQKEFKTNLGQDNFIFVGSSTDMFADDVPEEWITSVLDYCRKFDNRYLFQTKNPKRLVGKFNELDIVVCTTIETNRWYPNIMQNSQKPDERAKAMSALPYDRYVTIEPILDFDLHPLIELIKQCKPIQVNIGGDSGSNKMPEPDSEKLIALINALKKFTTIHKKRNIKRLLMLK